MRFMSSFLEVIKIVQPDALRSCLLVAMMVLSSSAIVLNTASVIPLLAFFGPDTATNTHQHHSYILQLLSEVDFATSIFIFMLLSVSSILLQAWTQKRISTFNEAISSRLAQLLFCRFLDATYINHVTRDPIDFTKTIISELNLLTSSGISAALNLIASLITLACIMFFLILVNYVVAICWIAFLLAVYSAIHYSSSKTLYRLGSKRLALNQRRARLLQDAFRSIRDIKLYNGDAYFKSEFNSVATDLAFIDSELTWLRQRQRFLFEAVFVSFVCIGLLVVVTFLGVEKGTAVQLIGIYLVAAFRVLPQGYIAMNSIASLQSSATLIKEISGIIKETSIDISGQSQINSFARPFFLISLDKITFSYPNSTKPAIHQLSLELEMGRTYGIIGASGSGKSTLTDLLMGMLTPSSGEVRVNRLPLSTTNVHGWRSHVGYVSQNVTLLNATLRENIAFGVDADRIDDDAVHFALQASCLTSDFDRDEDKVCNLFLQLGANGRRLSSGQMQRLGIARSLYRKPALLILDEATSALDNEMEYNVLTNIASAFPALTTIHVAHRHSTIRYCDYIIALQDGVLVAEGFYGDFASNSNIFKEYR